MIQTNESQIWQVLTGRGSVPTLQSWHETKEAAEKDLADCQRAWPKHDFWLEPGTDYIYTKCRHCESVHASEQTDHYGISTGYWCDDCYEHHYPYRKDAYYDPEYAGERMEEDY